MDLVTCGSVDGEAGRVGVNSRLTNGQVILMHEWPANTLTAIPQIAQVLASHNLCPGMISPQTGRAVAPPAAGGNNCGFTVTTVVPA